MHEFKILWSKVLKILPNVLYDVFQYITRGMQLKGWSKYPETNSKQLAPRKKMICDQFQIRYNIITNKSLLSVQRNDWVDKFEPPDDHLASIIFFCPRWTIEDYTEKKNFNLKIIYATTKNVAVRQVEWNDEKLKMHRGTNSDEFVYLARNSR